MPEKKNQWTKINIEFALFRETNLKDTFLNPAALGCYSSSKSAVIVALFV